MIRKGTTNAVGGGLLHARLPFVPVGTSVRAGSVRGRVEAFSNSMAVIAPFGTLDDIAAGSIVTTDPAADELPLGMQLLGRAIGASGAPLDGGGSITGPAVRVGATAISPDERCMVGGVAWTGIRAIDGLLPFAFGARIGIFGAPGTGKSSLVAALLRGLNVDVCIVALVGERGREAEEWIRRLTSRTTIVCATSDRSACERVRAAEVAFAQAHRLRARGLRVALLLDSLGRYANALREIAVATGEAVGRGGYPPSVFARIARTVEIAGATRSGSITLLATVLDDGDERDPVSDAARSLLDGHIALSQKLAGQGHFPAIDIGTSASRTSKVAGSRHLTDARIIREAIALLERTSDARSLGMNLDERTRRVVELEPEIQTFVRQADDVSSSASVVHQLGELARRIDNAQQTLIGDMQ